MAVCQAEGGPAEESETRRFVCCGRDGVARPRGLLAESESID